MSMLCVTVVLLCINLGSRRKRVKRMRMAAVRRPPLDRFDRPAVAGHHMTAAAEPFVHEALFYVNSDDYVASTVEFLREGLAAGEPGMAVVPGWNLDLIGAGLGADADRVMLADMTEAGRNPGRIIPQLLEAFLNEASRRGSGADHR